MSSRFTDYLQLGANIGILAGLVLVGLQIREANRATTAQLGFEAWNGSMATHEIIMGEDLASSWTKAQLNSDKLTARDITVVDALLNREWLHNARVSRISELGFNLVTMQLTRDKWIYSFLGNETAIRWWNNVGVSRILSNPELHKAIDASLAELGEDHKNYHKNRLTQILSNEKSPPDE